jgi:hypothetical protein
MNIISMLLCRLAILGVGLLAMSAETTAAGMQWSWHYEGAGISASGTLTTSDVANGAGYYQITAIHGTRNGVRISGLQPTGTAIPGNEPYPVDNLLSASGQHLTDKGLGFGLADGTFSNPFFAHTHTPPTYLEFLSAPQSATPGHTELPVHFMARIAKPTQGQKPGGTHRR